MSSCIQERVFPRTLPILTTVTIVATQVLGRCVIERMEIFVALGNF